MLTTVFDTHNHQEERALQQGNLAKDPHGYSITFNVVLPTVLTCSGCAAPDTSIDLMEQTLACNTPALDMVDYICADKVEGPAHFCLFNPKNHLPIILN